VKHRLSSEDLAKLPSTTRSFEWITVISLLPVLPLLMTAKGDLASAYATASLAFQVLSSHEPTVCMGIAIPSRGTILSHV
jgi:hypothetical protein